MMGAQHKADPREGPARLVGGIVLLPLELIVDDLDGLFVAAIVDAVQVGEYLADEGGAVLESKADNVKLGHAGHSRCLGAHVVVDHVALFKLPEVGTDEVFAHGGSHAWRAPLLALVNSLLAGRFVMSWPLRAAAWI